MRRAATHKPTTCVRPPQQQRVIHRSLTRHERPSTASEALREAEASLVEALRNLEASFEHKLEEVVNALLEEIRRIRELLSKFEVSEDAVMAFVQTVSELLGDKPLTVKDAQRAGILAAAGTSWENELGPLASSADVRQLLGDISRQRVDELLRARRLIGLRDHAGRRQFPLFQFADGQPVDPLIAAYWTVADGAANEWTAASWCVAPDPALQGASPAQWARARRDPDRLLAVARQDAARLAR